MLLSWYVLASSWNGVHLHKDLDLWVALVLPLRMPLKGFALQNLDVEALLELHLLMLCVRRGPCKQSGLESIGSAPR